VSSFDARIKDAGGVTEIYYAFSTLYDSSKWADQCQQNMVEIYARAKSLLEHIENGDGAENVWPTLDDLAFHAAIFGCYYHIFDSALGQSLASGDIPWNDPSGIVEHDLGSDLKQVLGNSIGCFENLVEAFNRKDVVAQRRHLTELYLLLSRLQCFAARNRLGT